MATPNLNLEEIILSDKLKTDFIRKINSNMEKIDDKYGELKRILLEKTKQDNLESAIAYIDMLVDANDATVTPEKLFVGYSAYKGLEKIEGSALAIPTSVQPHLLKNGFTAYDNNGNLITGNAYGINTSANSGDIVNGKTAYSSDGILITGTAKKEKKINVTLTGNSKYVGYISGYGAGIDHNGNLIIWAMSNSKAYESINFVNTSIGAGVVGDGFNITSHDTSNSAKTPQCCIVKGLSDCNEINITLNASAVNSSYDYVTLQVTLTVL